jgi:hypothetical protein
VGFLFLILHFCVRRPDAVAPRIVPEIYAPLPAALFGSQQGGLDLTRSKIVGAISFAEPCDDVIVNGRETHQQIIVAKKLSQLELDPSSLPQIERKSSFESFVSYSLAREPLL